jgi:ribosomal-protein-alanine N-acetyltransferase
MTLVYKMGAAPREEIHWHLNQCDRDFTPPLSSRVDLLSYSGKLFENAVSFEAWEDSTLVGMVCAYLNDMRTRTGFITCASVLKGYRGKGVASKLLEMCLEHARKHSFGKIKLEVSASDCPAMHLYSKAGFEVVRESRDSLLMECSIRGPATEEVR